MAHDSRRSDNNPITFAPHLWRKSLLATTLFSSAVALLPACTYSVSWSARTRHTSLPSASVVAARASTHSSEPTTHGSAAAARTHNPRPGLDVAPARRRSERQSGPTQATQRAQPNAPTSTPKRGALANTRPAQRGSSEAACYAGLRKAGVAFQTVPKSKASGVDWPIKLEGPVGGIDIHGGNPKAKTNYLDCRLAQTLLAWVPELQRAGVVGLQHYSMFREGARVAGTGKVSAHAHGTAIDVAQFELRDGSEVSVLDDWTNRGRGENPCQNRATDSQAAHMMRKLVCEASEDNLFQTVITPHYNDAHRNHVHLEIDPAREGRFIG